MIDACVVDANVAIKLFIVEEASEKAGQLFTQITEDPDTRFFVPDLFYVECANVLWKYVRQYSYPADSARQDLIDLGSLSLFSMPNADLLSPTLELALQFGISAYDACYLALAEQLGLPLVTADKILVERTQGSEITVLMLEALA